MERMRKRTREREREIEETDRGKRTRLKREEEMKATYAHYVLLKPVRFHSTSMDYTQRSAHNRGTIQARYRHTSAR